MEKESNKFEYRDAALPVERRVKSLLACMTLEEKAAQMQCVWLKKADTLVDEKGNFDPEKARKNFPHGIGQIGRLSDTAGGISAYRQAELANEVQEFFRSNTRLGIPVFIHEECLHGHAAIGGTSYPQPIALGGSFDPEMVRRIYEVTAKETRLRGAHQALTPVVDVARDPRWGRVEETFGEDPYLAGEMGVAAVQGFQGDSLADKEHLVCTLKHFAAHGQPESGTNCAPVNVSTRILREVFLYPFRKAIQAGAISVMASYNEIDGVPSHANKWLLRDVLRGEWGFKGYIVSDYFGIRELNERPGFFGQFLAKDGKEAAALAVRAGVNIELPDWDCYLNLVALVKDGTLKEAQLDELISPMLEWKFRMGLFEDALVDPVLAQEIVNRPENAALALEAALKSITLLKNDDDTLPLQKKKIKKLAVIGPNADRVLLGGYSGVPAAPTTVLQGIREYLKGEPVEILYHEGCKITIGGSWVQDEVVLSDPIEDRKTISRAAALAQQADVVILAIGGNEQTSREAWDKNHKGDRADINMVGRQDELVDAVMAADKPTVALLFNGSPLTVNNVVAKVPAIIECWYLGQETGPAIARTLFGENNPGAKLSISIPRSVGHVPCYYNHKPSARRSYLFDEVSPLFAFGYGLSYTRFEISEPRLSKPLIAVGEVVEVSVEVKNAGPLAGDEVVQMYIRDCYSTVARPVKELKGFQRITLAPGEIKTVSFEISPEHLSFYNIDMEYIVEPGEFKIMVGNSSRSSDLKEVVLIVQ